MFKHPMGARTIRLGRRPKLHGLPTVDINESGATILSTKITIDVGELTSVTAAAAPVISDADLADDAEMTIDIDVAGTGAAGLKVTFIGTYV